MRSNGCKLEWDDVGVKLMMVRSEEVKLTGKSGEPDPELLRFISVRSAVAVRTSINPHYDINHVSIRNNGLAMVIVSFLGNAGTGTEQE